MTEVRIERSLLAEADHAAAQARARYNRDGTYVLNLMSSPGAGKTSLLEHTLERLAGRLHIGVVEGDIQGRADADRVARFNVPVTQINTHGACHLDPRQVTGALDELGTGALELLVIENVGNLVCPAEFDLGEHARVMLLSVPEGDDKPGKYPLMFCTSDLLLINKIDLLGVCDFDPDEATRVATALNPELNVLRISCHSGDGLDAWVTWLEDRVRRFREIR